MAEILNGIQQIGIGVTDAKEVFNWYRRHLGFDILVFSDEATASLMTKYTNGEAQRRQAYLSLNMKGGGGLEIWQFKDRTPSKPAKAILFGDLGINAMIVRSEDVSKTRTTILELSMDYTTEVIKGSCGRTFFYFKDPWENLVKVVEDSYSFSRTTSQTGGVMGTVIGVSNMSRSIGFYSSLLGYDQTIVDEIITLPVILGTDENQKYRRVILQHNRLAYGGFGALLGPSEIELVQVLERKPIKIFENRLWGDLGYIHICFDVHGMEALRKKAADLEHGFTVDSANSFDMGDAAGHFSYVEDPDGTLIEFVETHKVPVLKPLGLYLNLQKRNPRIPLPKWLVKTLKIHKVNRNL